MSTEPYCDNEIAQAQATTGYLVFMLQRRLSYHRVALFIWTQERTQARSSLAKGHQANTSVAIGLATVTNFNLEPLYT